jgi:hypothetical protein
MASTGFDVFVSLLFLATIVRSTQYIFRMNATDPIIPLSLSASWSVLGPFPAGMREEPFGGFSAATYGSFAELFASSEHFFSTYGPTNVTTLVTNFTAQVLDEGPSRARQQLIIDYPAVDWNGIRKSAGWSSLQWQMIALTDFHIGTANSALAITMDKTAHFAIVPATKFQGQQTFEWHTGDWYSYVAPFSAESSPPNSLPISHHLVHLNQGSYKLLVQSGYEIRIFGDPQDGDPKIKLGIDMSVVSMDSTNMDKAIDTYTDSCHSNVPHIIGGWFAGWGFSFAIRNTFSSGAFRLLRVEMVDDQAKLCNLTLESRLHVAAGQLLLVPVQVHQTEPLLPTLKQLTFDIILAPATAATGEGLLRKTLMIPLVHKPAFWEHDNDKGSDNAYIYSYLAPDHTVQLATATPPRWRRTLGTHQAALDALPPVILALHGAGVDLRDMSFSHSIPQQNESWVILPTGRSPWGYDWQLASFLAADAAVSSFQQHLYGLPPSTSEAEKSRWQFNADKMFVMGHSNGGQGAWYRLGRFPDRAIGGVVAAAYTKVADYVSFGWKLGRHFSDPLLDGLLHTSLSAFENDLFASNLAAIDLLIKYGSADANVPPWNSKDMAMIVDGWNRRSGLFGKVTVSEAPDKPHWWDAVFSEDDVLSAIESRCSSLNNPGFQMPMMPESFTLTVANPGEAGSKGGWQIIEIETPGRLARLEVHYTVKDEDGSAAFHIQARNLKRASFDPQSLGRYSRDASTRISSTTFLIDGFVFRNAVSSDGKLHFVKQYDGSWIAMSAQEAAKLPQPRKLGPLLGIVSTFGPMVIVVPSGVAEEAKVFGSLARRFAADLLLYGGINSQIVTDDDMVSTVSVGLWEGNVVTLGGPHINRFTRKTIDSWPGTAPFHFSSNSAQFHIQGRPFYTNDTGMLTLAPHPSRPDGLTLILHGIGANGIQRAARLLPSRTATMAPEWIVIDSSSDWMGQGGVKAAGWYDARWGWSESMSYLE